MRFLLSAATLLLSATPLLYAQTPAPAPAAGAPSAAGNAPTTTLHTSTQLVIVDVTVRDRNGHAIHNLKREDFTLQEAHQPQTLRAFDEVSSLPTNVKVPPAPHLPPGMFTNYTPTPTAGPLYILLIDALNTPMPDQAYLRQQLADFARHIPAGARIAVVGLANRLYFLQGFSSEPGELQATFNRLHPRTSALLTTAGSPLSTESLLDSSTDPAPGAAGAAANPIATSATGSALATSNLQSFIEQSAVAQTSLRIENTIEAFDQLGHWLVNFPGRKNLLWFSGAFPLDVVPNTSIQHNTDIPGENSNEFRAMTNLLTQAQVSVYPIDPRGVQINSAFDASDTHLDQMGNFSQRDTAFFTSQASEHSTMQAIASDTGGEPFYNRNNLAQAVVDAMEAGANYYTLAYSPTEHKTGGEWRSIQVGLNGDLAHKGYQLSYRRGYFAEDLKEPQRKTGTGTVETANFTRVAEAKKYAHEALTRGAPNPTDILFTTRVLPHSTEPEEELAKGNVVDAQKPIKPPFRRFDVDLAARSHYFKLSAQPDGNYRGAAEAVVFVYDPQGKLINSAVRTLTFNFTPEAFARFSKEDVAMHLEVSAPARADSVLRIAVQDAGTGKIGALEVPLSAVFNLSPAPR